MTFITERCLIPFEEVGRRGSVVGKTTADLCQNGKNLNPNSTCKNLLLSFSLHEASPSHPNTHTHTRTHLYYSEPFFPGIPPIKPKPKTASSEHSAGWKTRIQNCSSTLGCELSCLGKPSRPARLVLPREPDCSQAQRWAAAKGRGQCPKAPPAIPGLIPLSPEA